MASIVNPEGSPIEPQDDVFVNCSGQSRRIRGVTVNSGATLLVSLAAKVGFESVWIEMEHGPADFERVDTMALAAEAGGIFPLVRLPDGERHHVLRALEAGARIILVPMVEDAAHAQRIVEYGKYPPLGARGFNTRSRSMGLGIDPAIEAMTAANTCTHLFAQIETITAMENLEQICGVDGLSGVFIGPGDLSVNMGLPGQANDKIVVDAVVACLKRARELGKLTGIFILPGPLLDAALAAGCDLVICGGDIMDLANVWTNLLSTIPAA